MAKKLDKILRIDNDQFEIQAVHSDTAGVADVAKKLEDGVVTPNAENAVTANTADKVKNKLTIQRTTLTGSIATSSTQFDGSSAQSITIVSADEGGRFNKRIAVPTDTRTTIDDEAVLNYGDIKSKVITNLTNTALAYSWNNTALSPVLTNANLAGVSIITGLETHVSSFATSNNTKYKNYPNNNNTSNIWLASYLYICTDTKNIFYGTNSSSTATRIATSTSSITTNNVTKDATNIKANEDEITKIKDGTTVVPKAAGATKVESTVNGQTYTTTAKEIRDKLFTDLPAIQADIAGIKSGTVVTSKATDAVNATNATYIKSGSSTLDYNAINDAKTKIESVYSTTETVKKAVSDASGNNITQNYYQSPYNSTAVNKIHIGANQPSTANNGDIWIKI